MKSLVITASILFLAFTGSSFAQDGEAGLRSISVQGSGSVSVVPDMAEVSIGVTTTGPAADQALRSNSELAEGVFKSLRSLGVAERDLQTSGISVNPRFRDRRNSGTSEPEIIGYVVENRLRVTVRDLSQLGKILDAVSAAGANNINGIRFDVEDREKLSLDALARAVTDAKRTANTIANAAEVELGELRRISHGGISQPRPFLARAEAMSVPVAPGSLTISANVSAVFGIR